MVDLNEIVSYYNIASHGNNSGSEDETGELLKLKYKLEDIPVEFTPFKGRHCNSLFEEGGLETRAEFCVGESSYVYDDCRGLTDLQMDDVNERLCDLPIRIWVNGQDFMTSFYSNQDMFHLSKAFEPTTVGCMVLKGSGRRNSACIVWEQGDGQLGYIEFIATKDRL